MKIYDRNNSNQKTFKAICEICERHGAIVEVGPEYYKRFLELNKKELEAIVYWIIYNRIDDINKKILEVKHNTILEWKKTDEEINEYVISFLEMIAQGVMGFKEKEGFLQLCFYVPVGAPSDEDMAKKLDAKIKSAIPLIDKVMRRMVRETDENKGGGNYANREEHQL